MELTKRVITHIKKRGDIVPDVARLLVNLGVMQPSDVTVEGSAAPFSPWDASTVSAATQPSHVQGSPLPVRPLPVPVPF